MLFFFFISNTFSKSFSRLNDGRFKFAVFFGTDFVERYAVVRFLKNCC